MATRRTTRRSIAAGSNENDLAARGPSVLIQAKPAIKQLQPTKQIKTASVVIPKVGTSASLAGTRKRSAFADVTNGAKAKATAQATKSHDGAAASSSTSRPTRSLRTRTLTNGDGDGDVDDDAFDDDEREAEDAMAVDEDAAAGERPVKQLRRVLTDKSATAAATSRASTSSAAVAGTRRPALTSKAANSLGRNLGGEATVPSKGPSKASLAARRRREQAEAAAQAAQAELEAARREEEEEHRAKKARTSEPDHDYDDEDELEEIRVEQEAAERAAAKDAGWEDLDEGDEEDPLMVSAYVVEVYEYLRELELTTMPDVDYMANQNEVTWKMRGILVDWLIEIHTKFRLLPETIFLATNLIDRFLSTRVVSLVKFQLVGVTALFIAAKYEEVVCPSVSNFLYMTDGGYQDDEILKAERYVLAMIDFNLSYPNPINFLRRISKADGYDIASRTMAKYLMEISIVDHKFMGTTPSMIAAAGCWLARRVLAKGEWDANLIHYSGYTEDELRPTAQLMLDYVVSTSPILSQDAAKTSTANPLQTSAAAFEQPHPNFVKKYAAKKFFKASTTLRKWAEEEFAPIVTRDPKTGKTTTTHVPALL